MTATASARASRRRRLLQDGVSAASSNDPAEGSNDTGVKVRYTPRDGSASFALASGVLPRSPGALVATGAALIAAAAALGWVDGIATTLAGGAFADLLSLGTVGSLSAWWETALWVAIACQAGILFGLRRQRTDDLGGGYRWWLVVAVAAGLMSLQSATRVHAQVATELAQLSGFSPLPGDAFWWLVPGVLLLGALSARTLLETRESLAASIAGGCGVASALLGWLFGASLIPTGALALTGGVDPSQVGPLASLAAASFAWMTLVLYSRRIVLEVEGAVAPPLKLRRNAEQTDPGEEPMPVDEPAKPARTATAADAADAAPRRGATKPAKPRIARTPPVEETVEAEEPPRRPAKAARQQAEAAAETQWVSGGESYDEAYDEDGAPKRRKLTKAERKRLRREKARRAA